MMKKEIIEKYAVFCLGIYFLAAGIVLIVRSALGTTPISSVNYVLSCSSPLSLGTWTFIFNMLLIVGQFYFLRGRCTRKDAVEILLQIPFSLLFSIFIDLNMVLTGGLAPSGYVESLMILALGCVVQSVGVVLEIKPHVAMMSGEAFVKYGSERSGMEFGKYKVRFDVTLVVTAILISLMLSREINGVREGTVVAALSVGYIVSFLDKKIMTRKTLTRFLGVAGIKQHEGI